ncbi:MAG: oligosaccharide repeat unit polymerase [Bacteroidales bacterium]|nr:oligosaccharide repeat unit polymerase [Bacteroidales bacterium]
MIKFKIKNTIVFLILISLFFILLFIGYNKITGIILYLNIMLINIFLFTKAYRRKNSPLLIFFLFSLLYAYALRYPLIDELQISVYYYFNDLDHIYKTSLLFYLFLIFLNLFIKIPKNPNKILIKQKDNGLFFYVFLIISIIFMIRGKTGENIFSGGYGTGLSSANSLNEYFLIPFFISIIFSNNSKRKKILLYIIAFIYALKNILYGGRIEVMMIALCIFIWDFNIKLKPTTIILITLFSFYFFKIIGEIRQNPQLLFTSDWIYLFIPSFKTTNSTVVISQEADVLYATNRLVSMVDERIINTIDRFKAFFYFILSIILPYSYLPDIANLASYKRFDYNVGGGGLIFGWFYVYLSYIGVILIAFYISKILSKIGLNNEKGISFINIYAVFVFMTMPRWFAYSPITMFKLSLYGASICFLVIGLDNMIKKYISKKKTT